jgi:hypothetical protein
MFLQFSGKPFERGGNVRGNFLIAVHEREAIAVEIGRRILGTI